MRALWMAVALVATAFIPAPRPAAAAIAPPVRVGEAQPVAPGVEHRRATVSAAAGTAAINVVTANLANESITLWTTLAQDRINAREAPTAQGLRHSRDGHRVVATINGSNFSAPPGIPYHAISLLVTGGELTSAGFRRADERLVAFGLNSEGRAFVGAPRLTITATLPDGSTIAIARVNQRLDGEQDSVLFTPRYDTSTKTTAPQTEVVITGVELPLRPRGSYSGTISEVRLGTGDAPLAQDSLVISANGAVAAALAPLQAGQPLAIDVSIEEPWHDVVLAVGGREVLMKNGAIDIFPTNGRKFGTPHPRSAVGVTADGKVLMVAVDGRQEHSGGVTVPEMAELMRELGAVDAINLDGGGSTVLSARTPGHVEAAIVNSPSSGIERTVSNALHVISKVPTGPLAGVVVLPDQPLVKEGEIRQLRLAGYDAAYNGVEPDAGPVSWTWSDSAVSIDEGGVLTAHTPGEATVAAAAGDWSASTSVRVVADTGVLSVTPPSVALMPETTAGKRNVALAVSWQASNPKADVTLVELQARVNSGAWTSVPLVEPAASSAIRRFRFGPWHQLRVRATDSAGNSSGWVVGTPFRLRAYELTHATVERVGAWRTIRSRKAIGGRFIRTHAIGASLKLPTAAEQVAVIAQRGSRGGMAAIGFEGSDPASVNLYAGAIARRAVVWVAQPVTEPGTPATVVINNVSPGTPSRVDIDAVVVLLSGN